MANFTNQSQNTTSYDSKNITGLSDWDDSEAKWGATLFTWNSQKTQYSNQSQNTTSFTNQTKN